ncbi:agmatinase family protein [Xanthovirga aplysinae]|uniref:agmatinase family protein n=1 Tax=Xanthovirga aplysinae TaxID=2529853 RepID=UPI0012BD3980|nr:agmatinase family protein [Xanthovirga aplysinae]MTI29828.1 agmatinase family protein [Xanthovirga aplysinae]
MTKEDYINTFDPNGVGVPGSLFGLPFSPELAEVVVIPVPWEVTVSYSAGTIEGPLAILEASPQLDLYVKDIPDAWKMGIAMLPVSNYWANESDTLRAQAEKYIRWLEDGGPETRDEGIMATVSLVNTASAKLNEWVKAQSLRLMDNGKVPVVLGGDHSTPLGLINALGERHKSFGILQIDAHADLREAYEGFEYSHASIMYNAMKNDKVSKLVQVGIRDYCEEEANRVQDSNGRIVSFYENDFREKMYEGGSWKSICEEIVSELPQKVYISFDIDGLDPKLCPNTGTPVPGGLEFHEAMFLIKHLVRSGREIIGFDLSEVSPSENTEDQWDGNVGARVLYNLANFLGVSQKKLKMF